MSDMKRVNPEVVKKAAQMVRPDIDWQIHRGADWFVIAMDDELNGQFDPTHSDSDAWALERALKREEWWFGQLNDLKYGATRYADKARNRERIDICDNSDTLLLLKCVSAITSLPLYAEAM